MNSTIVRFFSFRAHLSALSTFPRYNRINASWNSHGARQKARAFSYVPDCVSRVITLHPHGKYYPSSSFFFFFFFSQRAYFLPLSRRSLITGANKNGVPRFALRPDKTVAACEFANDGAKTESFTRRPKRAFIKMHARTAHQITTITIMASSSDSWY